MSHIKLLFGAWSLFAVVGCTQPDHDRTAAGTAETVTAATAAAGEDIKGVLMRAESAYRVAKEKDHAWIVTDRLLASANAALTAGNEERAMVDAKRALFTAQASIAQANKEGNDWRSRVPRQPE